jgi:hypothetical protein
MIAAGIPLKFGEPADWQAGGCWPAAGLGSIREGRHSLCRFGRAAGRRYANGRRITQS